MRQKVLFGDEKKEKENRVDLGSGLSLEMIGGQGKEAKKVILYRQNVHVKTVDLSDRVAKRLFIVEAVELGARKSRLAGGLGISRQTIENQLEIKEHFGSEGMVQAYTPRTSKSRSKQRDLHKEELSCGNK